MKPFILPRIPDANRERAIDDGEKTCVLLYYIAGRWETRALNASQIYYLYVGTLSAQICGQDVAAFIILFIVLSDHKFNGTYIIYLIHYFTIFIFEKTNNII